MTAASDSFGRANETPIASPWASCYGGGANLTSNRLVSVASTDKGSIYTGTWGANHRVSCIPVALNANSQYAGLLLRGDASGNAIQVYTDGTSGAGHTGVVVWTAGAAGAELGNWATTFNGTTDVMDAEVAGTSPNISVSLYKNSVLVATVTGITGPNSGNPGGGCFGIAGVTAWSATDGAAGGVTLHQVERSRTLARGLGRGIR